MDLNNGPNMNKAQIFFRGNLLHSSINRSIFFCKQRQVRGFSQKEHCQSVRIVIKEALYGMDARAKSKALFRAKLNAQKQEKQRIDSPLVRYNEQEQLICRVCDVVIKSEALWPAHQASRKHHEAIDQLKANAAGAAKPQSTKDLQKPKPEQPKKLEEKNEHQNAPITRGSSSLPPDFFDGHKAKKPKIEGSSRMIEDSIPHGKDSETTQLPGVNRNDGQLSAEVIQKISLEFQSFQDQNQVSGPAVGSEAAKQAKGALPEGFFDNKDADLRARGIVPVKPDVKDEYKEFEKLIKDDLQEIDNRLEEEEFDAAEMIEEEETVEQQAYKQRVELLRSKKLELKASKSAAAPKDNKVTKANQSSYDESSDDSDEDDQHFKIDWRARHL